MTYRHPRRATTKQVAIALAIYITVMVAVTLAWEYRDVIGGWW